MEWILWILATAGLAAALPILFQARHALQSTTLRGAWGWALAGLTLWTFTWLLTNLTAALDPPLADLLWYATAVLMLCPLIAVLGAKRPGSRVWTWFVLLPLLLVLGWPALVHLYAGARDAPLQLEVPAVIGYFLVLVMGTGNYFGTRFTGSSVLLAAALILLVAPFSAAVPAAFPDRQPARAWATLCLGLAVLWTYGQARAAASFSTDELPSRFDRLWIDYRDWFGIVWAKRIQDRVNQTAEKERWPARLEMHGLVWTQPDLAPATQADVESKIEHTLRWLLRRFVDPDWIDARLPDSR